MSDLIDRQAAIDALNDDAELLKRALDDTDLVGDERAKFEWGLGLVESCITDVKELPSAQPEIIRCKDCDWWKKQEDSLQGRCDLLRMYPSGAWYCGNARRRQSDEAD